MNAKDHEKIKLMQKVTTSYDKLHSLFVDIANRLIEAEDIWKPYNIKGIEFKQQDELQIYVIGKTVCIKFAMVSREQMEELGRLQIIEINNDTETIAAEFYFNEHALSMDRYFKDPICDIGNKYLPENFFFILMDVLLRRFEFI